MDRYKYKLKLSVPGVRKEPEVAAFNAPSDSAAVAHAEDIVQGLRLKPKETVTLWNVETYSKLETFWGKGKSHKFGYR